jgi:hypothetical protein
MGGRPSAGEKIAKREHLGRLESVLVDCLLERTALKMSLIEIVDHYGRSADQRAPVDLTFLKQVGPDAAEDDVVGQPSVVEHRFRRGRRDNDDIGIQNSVPRTLTA